MSFEKSSSALVELVVSIGKREKEVSYSCGVVGGDFVLGPGKITIIGAPPGTGKTALVNQIVFEALDEHPDLRLWVANCEMSIEDLLRRELSRQSGVAHKRILKATFDDEEHSKIIDAADRLTPSIVRVCHMLPPFTCEELAQLSMVECPGILVVDYLQKFRSSDRDARAGVDEVVACLRGLAFRGWAVLALSATKRSLGGKHDPKALDLASFKESGEIEFNADAAYILRDVSERESPVKDVDLVCVKNRSGSLIPSELRFCGDFMRFENRSPPPFEAFEEYAETAGGFA